MKGRWQKTRMPLWAEILYRLLGWIEDHPLRKVERWFTYTRYDLMENNCRCNKQPACRRRAAVYETKKARRIARLEGWFPWTWIGR